MNFKIYKNVVLAAIIVYFLAFVVILVGSQKFVGSQPQNSKMDKNVRFESIEPIKVPQAKKGLQNSPEKNF